MALARERLRDTDQRLAAIAQSLGYGSEFAFAAAFKRHHGAAPGRWRTAKRARRLTAAVSRRRAARGNVTWTVPRPSTSTVSPGAQAAMSWASSRSRRRRIGQRRQPEDRRDGEQQPAVGDHRDGRVGGVDAVEHERADQAAVDAADAARDRDQAAELADEVGDEQDADRRDVVAERLEADAEHGHVEEQVGGGADQDRRIALRAGARAPRRRPRRPPRPPRRSRVRIERRASRAGQRPRRRAPARSAATAAIAGMRPSRTLGEPCSRPVASPRPPRARKPTLARLVSRKNATVRRAMKAVVRPPRRRIHAPSASPPAPPTESTELAASSDSPISVLVRQLIRRQKTPRKTSTYPAQEPELEHAAASASHSGCAPAKRSRSEPSPGTSTISAATPTTIAPTISSERRRFDGENSSGSASASTIGLEVLHGDDRPGAHAHSQTAIDGMATIETTRPSPKPPTTSRPCLRTRTKVPWKVLSNRAEAAKPAAR